MSKGGWWKKDRTLAISEGEGSLYNPSEGNAVTRDSGAKEFATRFGLGAVIKRNENILVSLTNPTQAVNDINDAYKKLSLRSAQLYNQYYGRLIAEGVPSGVAQGAADEYILPFMEGELKILELQFPFTFGNLGGSVGADNAGHQIFSTQQEGAAQSMRAANVMAKVLGVNKYPGIKKGKKKKKSKM